MAIEQRIKTIRALHLALSTTVGLIFLVAASRWQNSVLDDVLAELTDSLTFLRKDGLNLRYREELVKEVYRRKPDLKSLADEAIENGTESSNLFLQLLVRPNFKTSIVPHENAPLGALRQHLVSFGIDAVALKPSEEGLKTLGNVISSIKSRKPTGALIGFMDVSSQKKRAYRVEYILNTGSGFRDSALEVADEDIDGESVSLGSINHLVPLGPWFQRQQVEFGLKGPFDEDGLPLSSTYQFPELTNKTHA